MTFLAAARGRRSLESHDRLAPPLKGAKKPCTPVLKRLPHSPGSTIQQTAA